MKGQNVLSRQRAAGKGSGDSDDEQELLFKDAGLETHHSFLSGCKSIEC